jgi:hypothetical protein
LNQQIVDDGHEEAPTERRHEPQPENRNVLKKMFKVLTYFKYLNGLLLICLCVLAANFVECVIAVVADEIGDPGDELLAQGRMLLKEKDVLRVERHKLAIMELIEAVCVCECHKRKLEEKL